MQSPIKILIVFHTPSNAGYAMSALEKMFFDVCLSITKNQNNIFFSFKDLSSGKSKSLPEDFDNFISLDYDDNQTFESARNYIKKHAIDFALCFDVQPNAQLCTMLRESGIKKIISYWGSTISSRNNPVKLLLKKIEVFLRKDKPDHFIFESHAMRELAVLGRGIAERNTSVINTGIDISRFKPSASAAQYVSSEFKLPENANIIFYSGHMETRKGVAVIMNSAIELIDNRNENNLFFIICGNRPKEEEPFLKMLQNTRAYNHVVFAGYRNDLPLIMPGCKIGVVASTGWDSFPMSTLEMAACGLPIVVSRLQGLVETVEDGMTGFTFNPGDAIDLAEKISKLINDKNLYQKFSEKAALRIHDGFQLQHQFLNLQQCLLKVFKIKT